MSELTACACMGAVHGEPHCPCVMAQRGMCMSIEHVKANEDAEKRLEVLFGPGGPFYDADCS